MHATLLNPTHRPSPLDQRGRWYRRLGLGGRLVDSTEEAARIAQNLRADERIGVGTHLGAASPIHGAGVLGLDPSGIRIRRESRGMIRALLLGHPLGVGWRGKDHGEPHGGNEQSGAEMCRLDPRHGRSPTFEDVARSNIAPLGGSGQLGWITPWCQRTSSAIEPDARERRNNRSRLPAIAGAYGGPPHFPSRALRPAAAP